MLEKYLENFSRLRTYKDHNKWSALTTYQAPHKPFLLLSVMDLINQGAITQNFIEPSFELVDTFNYYWNSIMPPNAKTSIVHPFIRLKTDGFWHLISSQEYENQINIDSISSILKLQKVCAGARLDKELYELMCRSGTRKRLRSVLVTTYFSKEIQTFLSESRVKAYGAYNYSKELLKGVKEDEGFYNKTDLDEKGKSVRERRDKMFGFISFIEKGGNYIGGYLATDEEFMPREFSFTETIKQPTKLQKILYGAQFDTKWYGDLIAGTLFRGAKESDETSFKEIKVVFVSNERMLHLRRNTGDIPVAFIDDSNKVVVHSKYHQDEQLITSFLEKEIERPELNEVFDRIKKGIEEALSQTKIEERQ